MLLRKIAGGSGYLYSKFVGFKIHFWQAFFLKRQNYTNGC
jgi:hypothetical protein